jgi:DNA-directed RNA polymerase subunit omega
MARVTVEDCTDKVDSPYELVMVAKERATQLNSGIEPTLDRDNDKNTVISLREIASENIKVPDLIESAIYKLRKHVEQVDDGSEEDEVVGDDFENLYKGEISKSGTPILPSKRARKIPEKIQVSKEDLDELKTPSEPTIETSEPIIETSEPIIETSEPTIGTSEPAIVTENEQTTKESVEESNVSLDELSDAETKSNETNQEDSETSNS